MEKLIYKKYKGCNDILEIDLHNGYLIIAIKGWDKESHCYNVELRLKEKTIEKWDLIEEASDIEFKTTQKNINSAILCQVAKYLENGFFDYYIKRYEYEGQCFDVGNEVIKFED